MKVSTRPRTTDTDYKTREHVAPTSRDHVGDGAVRCLCAEAPTAAVWSIPACSLVSAATSSSQDVFDARHCASAMLIAAT
jgi:hypothetical protein